MNLKGLGLKAHLFLALALLLVLPGCSGTYYEALEKIGVHKRDLLVSRVKAARDSQQEAKAQFSSALDHFLAVTNVPATDLARTYERLNREFERSEARAKEVRDRVGAVNEVSEALFAEWRKELGQYSSGTLRSQSERQLEETRRRYADLMRVMKQATDRMKPVLDAFRDQVLFLKHNLNAQSITALSGTSRTIQQDISRLLAEMEQSIREADAFMVKLREIPE